MSVFNEDFKDFIKALNNQDVEYILIGGYAVILHGYPRNTGDMDIWVNGTKKNYEKLKRAFFEFGMPLFDMTEKNFLRNDAFDVFTFGVSPISIDIMTKAKGLNFDAAFPNAYFDNSTNVSVRVIAKDDLIRLKKAANRPKDINDMEHL